MLVTFLGLLGGSVLEVSQTDYSDVVCGQLRKIKRTYLVILLGMSLPQSPCAGISYTP